MPRHAKALVLIAFLLFSGSFSLIYAQKTGTFQHIYGAIGNEQMASSVVALPDKGFMMAGITQVNGGNDTSVIRAFDSISLTCDAIHAALITYKGSTSDTVAITAYLNNYFHINQPETVFKKAFYQCKLTNADTMYFDGKRYVDYGANTQYHIGHGNFTVEAWVASGDGGNNAEVIMCNQSFITISPYQYFPGINAYLYQHNLCIAFGEYCNPPPGYLYRAINTYCSYPNDSKWHYVVIERTGKGNNYTDIKMWVDGVSQTVYPWSDNTNLLSGNIDSASVLDMKVGSRIGSFAQQNFAGSIREARLYRRALGSAEITRNYNNGCVTIPSDTASLVLWAPLNDGSGYKCVDESHYHATGTVRDSGSGFWGSSSFAYCYANLPVIRAPIDSVYLTCESIHKAMISYSGSISDTTAITAYLNSYFHISQTETVYKKAFYQCKLTAADTMYFDGTRYVDFPDRSAYHVGHGNFTMEGWVSSNDGGYAPQMLMANESYTYISPYQYFPGTMFHLYQHRLYLAFGEYKAPPPGYAYRIVHAYCSYPNDTKWHYVVAERTGTGNKYTDVKMWIDGVAQTVYPEWDNTYLISGDIDSTPVLDMKLGSRIGSWMPQNLVGSEREMRYYTRAISSTEITNNYNNGCVTIPSDTAGLVLWAPLNDGSGYFCVDESHYHATGTVRDSGSGFWGYISSNGGYCYPNSAVIRAQVDSVNLTCDALHTAMSAYTGNTSDTAAITTYLNSNFHINQTEIVYKKAFYQCKLSAGPVEKILIVRTDSMGKQIWSKTYAGTGVGNNSSGQIDDTYLYSAVDMILTPEGNVVVCSNTFNEKSVYLIKINQNGSILWSKTYSGTNYRVQNFGSFIIKASDGGYMLTGAIGVNNAHGEAFVIKTDSAGNIIWSNTYYHAGFQGCGFRITPANRGYLVCGVARDTSSNTQFGYPGNYLIMKIGNTGKLIWSKVYGNSSEDESANSIIELPDKSIYVCGQGEVPGEEGATLMKLDSNGNLLWSKIYIKGTSVTDGVFRSLIYDSINNVLNISYEYASAALGEFSGVIRLDTTGKIVFIKSYGPGSLYVYRSVGHNFLHLLDGGFTLLVSFFKNVSNGGWNYFLTKTDSGANTDNCNILPFKKLAVPYPVSYLYSCTSGSLSPTIGSGCTVANLAVQDSAFCTSLIANFGLEYICFGQKTQFLDSSFYQPVFWKWDFGDGATSTLENPVHQYAKDGPYVVKLVTGNGTLVDSEIKTVNILQSPSSFSLDTVICSGDSILLDAKNPGATYLWNNGDTTMTKTVHPGFYWVKVSLGTCSVTDSIRVIALNTIKINLGNDTTICEGNTLTLKAGYVGTKWSTGETGSDIKVNKAGKYWAVLKGSNCAVSDTILVNINKINLGKDTTLCKGDTLTLNSGYAGAVWSTGAKGDVIKVNKSGKYWAALYGTGCPVSDTIRVTYDSLTFKIDSNICKLPYTLSGHSTQPLNNAIYLWNTGNTDSEIVITNSGKYWLNVKSGKCNITDSAKVSVESPLVSNLGGNRTVCDSLLILNPGQNLKAAYLWSNKDTGKTITINTSGRYWVSISRYGCLTSDTTTITLLKPEIFGANNLQDTVFCSDDSVLVLDAGPAYKYLWSPGGNTTRQINITQSGTYTVQIAGTDGCTSSKTITITDDCSTPGLYVPNAFSPDSNGHNEVFMAYGVHIASFSMSVYNRWGEKLFSCHNISTGWDGKFKGDYCLNGMYVYDINYSTDEASANVIKIKGTVYLIR